MSVRAPVEAKPFRVYGLTELPLDGLFRRRGCYVEWARDRENGSYWQMRLSCSKRCTCTCTDSHDRRAASCKLQCFLRWLKFFSLHWLEPCNYLLHVAFTSFWCHCFLFFSSCFPSCAARPVQKAWLFTSSMCFGRMWIMTVFDVI